MFFDLVGRVAVIHAPLGGVGVSPLAPDDDVRGGDVAEGEPRGEEVLGEAVGSRGVEVANARGPGGVEHGVGLRAHLLDILTGEVVVVAEVDVPGAAERGEAQTKGRSLHAGVAEAHRVVRGDGRRGGNASE